MKTSLPALLSAFAVCCLPAAASADQTDRAVNDLMPDVYRCLADKGHKTVGVLRFRVQLGKKPARFDNAPFNGNLPVRVENLLIMHGGDVDEPAVRVIRDASKSATASDVGDWFGDVRERKKLFGVTYGLAWGDGKQQTKVKADAFLTGLVRLSEDLKKTTLILYCFDKDDLEPKAIAESTIDTERNVLSDLGYSFVVPSEARRSLLTKRSVADVDRNVLAALDSDVRPSDVAGIRVTVLVDDEAAELQPAKKDEEGPRWKLPCPPRGKAVSIRLENRTDERLGVVVKLNGISLFQQQTRAANRCRKWVIPAGKKYELEGFYEPGQGKRLSLRPFVVLVGDEAKKAKEQLGDKAGLLEVDVFAEGAESDEGFEISARGLPPAKDKEKEKEARAQSYKAVRTSLLKDAKLKTETTKTTTKPVLVADEKALAADKYDTVDFVGHNVGRLAVKIVPRD